MIIWSFVKVLWSFCKTLTFGDFWFVLCLIYAWCVCVFSVLFWLKQNKWKWIELPSWIVDWLCVRGYHVYLKLWTVNCILLDDLIFVVNITTIFGTDIVHIILKCSNKCLYVKFCEIGYGYLILFHILAIAEFLS